MTPGAALTARDLHSNSYLVVPDSFEAHWLVSSAGCMVSIVLTRSVLMPNVGDQSCADGVSGNIYGDKCLTRAHAQGRFVP